MPPRGAKVGAAAGLPAEARDLHDADRTESQFRQTVSYMHADFAAADTTGPELDATRPERGHSL